MNCIHIERTKLYELYGTAAQCNSTVVTSYTYYTCNYTQYAIRKKHHTYLDNYHLLLLIYVHKLNNKQHDRFHRAQLLHYILLLNKQHNMISYYGYHYCHDCCYHGCCYCQDHNHHQVQ